MTATKLLSDNGVSSGITGYQLTGGNDGTLQLQTATSGGTATTAMTIDTSQNVGIGTSSPNAKLQVNGGIYNSSQPIITTTATLTSSCFGTMIEFANGPYTVTLPNPTSFNGAWFDVWLNTGSNITFSTPAGNFYGPSGNATNSQALNQTNGFWYRFASDGYNWAICATPKLDSNGNFLISKTAVDWTNTGFQYETGTRTLVLTSANDILALRRNTNNGNSLTFYKDNTFVGSISVTASATAYNTSSDYRLKHDIQPMTGALTKVAALKPCTYKWNTDDSAGEGFIAHELQAVVPDCVTGEKDAVDADGNPKYQGIDTSFLVATLTAAIQEQQALINNLTERITALEAK